MIKGCIKVNLVILFFTIVLKTYSFGEGYHPQFTKGIYINKFKAGDEKCMNKILEKFGSLINTLVIDVKDSHGTLSYKSKLKTVRKVGAQGTSIKDIKHYVKELKEKGYYLIGRIAVFRDPKFARYKRAKFGVKVKGSDRLFRDENGFVWVDPFSEDAWRYNIRIAEEAAKAGFDEIQFDYVRFPSCDGNLIPYFPFQKKKKKEEAILSFFSLANEKLKGYGVNISIALFGYTAWHNHLPREGQFFSEMGRKVDFVYPMLYPSHFADDFLANKDKTKRTYNIVFKSIRRGKTLLRKTDCKLIPYIQGFDWKRSRLGKNYIEVQMKACKEADAKGWIVWNAKCEYEEAYIALLKYTLTLVKPDIKPRLKGLLLSGIENEEKSEKPDTRGIEAIVCW